MFHFKIEILSYYSSSKINIEQTTKQTPNVIQNLNLILTESKISNKRSKETEILEKSNTRKTVIFGTELEMLSYQKIQ